MRKLSPHFRARIIAFCLIAISAFSCNPRNNTSEDKTIVKQDSGEIIEPRDTLSEVKLNKRVHDETTFNIDSFLREPFNLYEFKNIRKHSSNSSSISLEDYHWRPDTPGIGYSFHAFQPRITRLHNGRKMRHPFLGYYGTDTSRKRMGLGVYIRVFQPRNEHMHMYANPTEILVEARNNMNDFELPEMQFAGIDTSNVKARLGEPSFRKHNCLVYTSGGNSLILTYKGRRVSKWKYIRLNYHLTEEMNPEEVYGDW